MKGLIQIFGFFSVRTSVISYTTGVGTRFQFLDVSRYILWRSMAVLTYVYWSAKDFITVSISFRIFNKGQSQHSNKRRRSQS